jgi:hypothetical protein
MVLRTRKQKLGKKGRKTHNKKHTRKVRFSNKKQGNNKKTITKRKNLNKKTRNNKIIKRVKTPYMKGGNMLDQFMPKNFNAVVPFLPPKGSYVPLSNDMHGTNNILENSSNIPTQKGGVLGDLISTATDLIPTDITNLGRNALYSARGVYSGFIGDTLPDSANPNTIYQPKLQTMPEYNINPTDINTIYEQADMKTTTL